MADYVGMAFVVGAALVQSVTESTLYGLLAMALGMVLNGAQDETLDAMKGVLGFDGPDPSSPSIEEINESYSELLALLVGLDPAVEMEVKDKEFVEDKLRYLDASVDKQT